MPPPLAAVEMAIPDATSEQVAAPAVPAGPWTPTIPPPTPPAEPVMSTPAPPPAQATNDQGAAASSAPADRLPPGELRRQVTVYLIQHPDQAWTPTQIGAELGGRSSGAVLNACEHLADQGYVSVPNLKPKMFRATEATRDALTALPTTTPTSRRARPPRPAEPAHPPAPSVMPSRVPPTQPDGGVIRRGGQVYRPRRLAGAPDVQVLRTLRDAHVPVLLYGPPGTGKTSLVEAAHGDLITVAGDGDTTVGDLVGEYTQAPGGGYTFVYGPLITAMQQGRCLFIDDATLISPAVLAVAYPAMDGRGEITVKAHKGETITAAPGFYVIAGHNPGVHGAILTEALSSRFSVQIEVTSDYKIAESLGVNPKAILLSRNLATKRAAGEIGWAPQLRELLAYQKIAAAVDDDFAIANLIGVAPGEDRDVVAQVAGQVYGRTITPLTLGAQVGRRRP